MRLELGGAAAHRRQWTPTIVGAFVALLAVMGAFASTAQADHGQGVGTTEITCNRVTWNYSQFPELPGNQVREQIKIAGVAMPATTFEFNGSTGSHTTTFNSPIGEYIIDAQATWSTNGIRGNFDHHLKLDCKPAITIVKEQRLAGEPEFTKRTLTGHTGQHVEYRIVVTNSGNRNLNLPEGLNDPNCTGYSTEPRSLEVEQSTEYTCEAVLGEAGNFVNVAQITGYAEEEVPVGGKSNEVIVKVSPAPEFSIEKTQEIAGSETGFVTTPLIGAVGQTVDYRITVTNTGNTPLRFEALKDAGCDPGTIAGGPELWLGVGQQATWTCSHLLTEADRNKSQYLNTASAIAFPPEGSGSGKHHTSNTVVVNFKGHGPGEGGTEITCTHVTFFYFNFPAGPTTATQKVTANGVVVSLTKFTFEGPNATDTVEITVPPGTTHIDANSNWKTGNFDHHAAVLCT